jgi:uncharacterized protein (TIGR02118 family)
MFKFTTLYRQVDDPGAVDDFFSQTHLPLAEQLEGLRKSEVSRIGGKPGGESRYYLMYELYFDSLDAYRKAMVSKTGIQLMEALKPWDEARIVTWFYAESFEEAAKSNSAETH